MSSLKYNAVANRFLGTNGIATMHGDAQSSDCTPFRGPGRGRWSVKFVHLGGACPTVLAGKDGYIQVLTTKVLNNKLEALSPVVSILHPDTGQVLSEMNIAKGALLGGVYAYLDDQDRMVLIDGAHNLLRIAHGRGGKSLRVDSRISLGSYIGAVRGDQAVSLVPDWQGRVWFATQAGRAAYVDPSSGVVRGIDLKAHRPTCFKDTEVERVTNSISACPDGVSIVTTHAVYLVRAAADGTPEVVWMHVYERDRARKPGKLAWGSGATPTFFGPTGHDYLMLTDNHFEREHVMVYRTKDGAQVGVAPMFAVRNSGTENSMIGIGNTVIGANTYGYPYPRYPDGAGKSDPENAEFTAGMERWDITPTGLVNRWTRNDVYSCAVPRYSTTDRLIYTCDRSPSFRINRIRAVAIDIDTGRTVQEEWLPRSTMTVLGGGDTLQMVGTMDGRGTWWQGTIMGVYMIKSK
ncbi:6-pyruvoyl tetrahydrobiopterin synthase [Falsarthrobacter nasiphocae]|uniref:6-pyruvoyl tetrahydrobiopterin synthase n=1 Tax=Falsarthrobacter nasiphocae TaxID=189863 RepID=A0AAE3YIE6_9MICC|nr:6-pyruvoyl tetrahydrobiopterin synthase [Falsarthrobacter nasiphocae]MDR6892336.1 hypothetical protein [Falsarthrobacter nasiphocae]